VTLWHARNGSPAAERTASPPATSTAIFRGAVYLPGDELVLCLFDASSRASVKSACEHARIPCERVIETVWVAAAPGGLQQEPPGKGAHHA
jgi:hypothetical protein